MIGRKSIDSTCAFHKFTGSAVFMCPIISEPPLNLSENETHLPQKLSQFNSPSLYQHARYAGILMCQLPVVAVWMHRGDGWMRCVHPTHSRSGWIRRKWWQENNSGRLSASGMVHFSPEAEGGPLVTLMDRNAAHPHTHTRPHMSHTLSVSHQKLARCSSYMDTQLVVGYVHNCTQAALSHQIWYPMWDVYGPPTLPSSSVNKLFPEMCVMHYQGAAYGGCSCILHHWLTHVHPSAP